MSRNGSTYHKLLNTVRWRRLRARKLERNPFCEDCAKSGLLTPAEEVHHIRPVGKEPTPERMKATAYDPSNLAALCHECHAKRHKLMKSHKRKPEEMKMSAEVADFWKRFG